MGSLETDQRDEGVFEVLAASLPGGVRAEELHRTHRLTFFLQLLEKARDTAGIASVALLKVDVEGAEGKVLAGIDEASWARVRQVVIETDGTESPAA